MKTNLSLTFIVLLFATTAAHAQFTYTNINDTEWNVSDGWLRRLTFFVGHNFWHEHTSEWHF